MSDNGSGTGAQTESPSVGQRLKRGVQSKVLVPLAVTVVSAAASYLLRKLPLLIEERVLPKLREQGAGGTVSDAVTAVAEKAAEVVPDLGGTDADDSPSADASSEDGDGATPSAEGEAAEGEAAEGEPSNEERENERREREERRRERRAVQRT